MHRMVKNIAKQYQNLSGHLWHTNLVTTELQILCVATRQV
jgi:hypothetical protein